MCSHPDGWDAVTVELVELVGCRGRPVMVWDEFGFGALNQNQRCLRILDVWIH